MNKKTQPNPLENRMNDYFEAVIEISAGSSAKFEMDRLGNFH